MRLLAKADLPLHKAALLLLGRTCRFIGDDPSRMLWSIANYVRLNAQIGAPSALQKFIHCGWTHVSRWYGERR
jgi:hypothetical protein